MLRRRFIQRLSASLSLLCLSLSNSLICLAERRQYRFANGSFEEHWAALTNGLPVQATQQISLTLPGLAENGAVVPIAILSRLNDLQEIYLLVEKNPTPLVAVFELSPIVIVDLHARIKMAESSNVHLLARQDQRWLHCRQWVQVTVGGCGSG